MGRKSEGKGQARPTAAQLPAIIEAIEGGASLRKACETLGVHAPSALAMIDADADICEQYVRACELRAMDRHDEGLTVTKAAALGLSVNGHKVDAAGARVYFDAIRWSNAQMAPKRFGNDQVKVKHEGQVGLNVYVKEYGPPPGWKPPEDEAG